MKNLEFLFILLFSTATLPLFGQGVKHVPVKQEFSLLKITDSSFLYTLDSLVESQKRCTRYHNNKFYKISFRSRYVTKDSSKYYFVIETEIAEDIKDESDAYLGGFYVGESFFMVDIFHQQHIHFAHLLSVSGQKTTLEYVKKVFEGPPPPMQKPREYAWAYLISAKRITEAYPPNCY